MAAEATSWQKEQVSRAYVHALATQGGYTICDWNVDKDGVDVTLRSRGLMVDIQLKCTQNPRTIRSGYSFDLDIETYDKLRDPERSAPGHLALLIVPPDIGRWVIHQPDSIVLACHGYWSSLYGMGHAPGGSTTAIHLPEHRAHREGHGDHVRCCATHDQQRRSGVELTWRTTPQTSVPKRFAATSRSPAGPRYRAGT
ncbi:DUF4365 domain-containing protein [Streptomyces caeruleatus]|uniref:DUF4365 domain-containing protein n=1 Tax=Streptomyces caeruleatus TaxID=661399 RepID=UPI001FC93BB9|nr:DUF4365 domain-containing protein [Streptomyces caeruleatus]